MLGPFYESSARALPEGLERSVEGRALESNPGLSPNAPSQCKRTVRNRAEAQAAPAPEGDRKGPSSSGRVRRPR